MAVGFDKFDVEKERARLQKLSDAELIREGKSARFLFCWQNCVPIRWRGDFVKDIALWVYVLPRILSHLRLRLGLRRPLIWEQIHPKGHSSSAVHIYAANIGIETTVLDASRWVRMETAST
jgi:hypothetical protein